jgi:hypothetical protein
MNLAAIAKPARGDWAQAGLVALGLLALYAATAPHTVALEDDGLFILSSYFLGIEHPPGYPLHTLLGKLFTLLPVGSVAYRVHLLSAVLGALSCGMLWMCARLLMRERVAAYVAALGLGVSRAFWSQAIIAEVYTFNTLFLFVLLYLGLRACPPQQAGQGAPPPANARLLPCIALLFGLSLANHWPLMLLAAPGLALLLWPLAREALRRAPLLLLMLALGLTPYAWMVVLSWGGLVISFDGPLESFSEFWFFVSRAGYAQVDVSPTADWIDRIRFFQFLGSELLVQFAVAGTLLAGIGFVVQWQAWGRRVSAGLTLAFLGPTVVLLLLLRFDYDSLHKHMFHVYPLPAYGIVALWMGLGTVWLAWRLALRAKHAAGCAAVLTALVFAIGSRQNLLASYDWAARYAAVILRSLPQNSIVLVRGDPDLAPIGYLHLIEGRRPDITLYQHQGLVLGNRLFHPLRTSSETAAKRVDELVRNASEPVVLTQWSTTAYARRDRWLYQELIKNAPDSREYVVDIPEDLVRFFEDSVLGKTDANAWAAYVQDEMRRQYGHALGRTLARDRPPPPRTQRQLDQLAQDFFGALGVVEGLLANRQGYSVTQAVRFLEDARDRMPSDASKNVKARFFELRAYLRLAQRDEPGALGDLETSIQLWPTSMNAAATALSDLYLKAGRMDASEALKARLNPAPRAR